MKKLGFGTMRLPLKDQNDPKSVDYEEFEKMADLFIEEGFNYFDTAYPYHEETSEIAVRECLVKRHKRDSFLLADKMPLMIVKESSDYERLFNEQLEKCGVDYFDYYLLHNIGIDRYDKTVSTGGFEFLKGLKEKGLAREIGISYHDSPVLLERVLKEFPFLDFIQLQINYLDWDSKIIASGENYRLCEKYGKKVAVMEPIKGGKLANLPDEIVESFKKLDATASPASFAIRFAASQKNVFMVLSGMGNVAQVKDNTSYMKEFVPLSAKETEAVMAAAKLLKESKEIPCTACAYCMETCPKHINIPAYFGLYNQYVTVGSMSNMYYERSQQGHGRAMDCIHCGLCEKNCPQHLPIRENLEKFAELYKKQETATA